MLVPVDPLRRGLNLRPALLAAGVTDRELRALRRSGRLAAVRPGAYAVDAPPGAAARHHLAARAALTRTAPGAVLSHVTAALVHGLPLRAVPLDRVHATRARRSGARRSRYLHLHAADLDPDEVVEVDGLPVTSPARTLVDLGRSLPFEQALVPADAALHRHLVDRPGLGAALERAARRRGNSAFARAGAESPGESRSRLALHRADLPAPQLQHLLTTTGGRALGRVDFWWEGSGVVGEFDGAAK
jgi:hypothetical protein